MDADELAELKKRMSAYMNDTFSEHGVDMLFFMLTDILDESTDLICAGEGASEAASRHSTPQRTAECISRDVSPAKSRSFRS